MSIFHDGCTAGPLSDWLNGLIAGCCDAHDLALDHSTDLGTFIDGNLKLFGCVWQTSPALAVGVLAAVASPVGWVLYKFGPKAKQQ